MNVAGSIQFLLAATLFLVTDANEKMLADDKVPQLSRKTQVTGSGCVCDGACKATANHYQHGCDWCWTKHNCGKRTLRGYWDNCIYPKMATWEGQTYKEKENQLWEKATAAHSVGRSAPVSALFDTVTHILSESMITTFDDQWDVLPEGRSKAIHQQGVLCKFDLDIISDGFTGIFSHGKAQGIIRMGSATLSDGSLGIHPGIALKFLRSGVRSANFVALTEAPTTNNYNFFWRSMSNIVAPSRTPLWKKFQEASGCISQVGLSDVCRYSQAGAEVASPVFPYEIQFEPAGMSFSRKKVSPKKLMRQLSSIASGTPIFYVYTYSSPTAKRKGKRKKLGTLITTSQCVQSLFGDKKLFFRHQRMEEDFALRPEWIPKANSDSCQASRKPISTWQCASPLKRASASNLTSIFM